VCCSLTRLCRLYAGRRAGLPVCVERARRQSLWHHAAVEPDWVARGIAIFGSTVALVALGWNIYAWRRQGPVIRVSEAICSGRGQQMSISTKGHNGGRFDTNIAKVSLRWRGSSTTNATAARTFSCNVPAGHIAGLTGFPKAVPAETNFELVIAGLQELSPSLEVALHERRWADVLVHTPSGRRARKRIKYA